MDNIKVTVLMLVYNGSEYLSKSIESILSQTFTEFELILMDNSSTDNSLEICYEYSKRDPRIFVYQSPENFNNYIDNIKNIYDRFGNYVMILDQDDWYEKDAIYKAYVATTSSDSDIVVFGYYINEDENSKYTLNEMELNNKEAIIKLMEDKEIQAYFWNKIYKKDLFIAGNFECPKDNDTFEDFCVMPYIFHNANKVKIIPDKLYHYYKNPSSFSSKTRKNLLNYYLAKSYWRRVEFLNKYYNDILSQNHALNIAFVNSLGVWKASFMSKNTNQTQFVEEMFVKYKDFISMTKIPLIKKQIIRLIICIKILFK